MLEPPLTGFITQGSPIALTLSASPSRNSTPGAIGIPASCMSCFEIHLFMASALPRYPVPVYGISNKSSRACSLPFSPFSPCRPMKTTSAALQSLSTFLPRNPVSLSGRVRRISSVSGAIRPTMCPTGLLFKNTSSMSPSCSNPT